MKTFFYSFSLSHYLTSIVEAKEPIKSDKISLLIWITPETLQLLMRIFLAEKVVGRLVVGNHRELV